LGAGRLRNLKRNNIKKDYRLRLTKVEHDLIKDKRNKDNNNVLVIGDLHEPFCLDEYLDFCIEQYNRFNCTEVVIIGDCLDNHYSSFHEVNIDADYTGKEELEIAINRIARWYKAFSGIKTTVIIGNHDRIIMRKAQTSAIPSKWIKSYKEVLEVPGWDFVERYVKDGVQYLHGEGGTARTKCRADMMNTVQGHLHTQAYCEHYVGQNFRVFGMQVGCGIDHESYAMAYAKYGKKPAIGCAVVLNNGKLPINLLMEL
jgi:metallophosphoesterase superfamily enzyme